MATTTDQDDEATAERILDELDTDKLENGELFDENSGDLLAQIELDNNTVPAQLSVFCNGYIYVFSITGRYKHEVEKPAVKQAKEAIGAFKEAIGDIKLSDL